MKKEHGLTNLDAPESCRAEYENVLVCTAIITNNPFITTFINGVFKTLYHPTRPVRLFHNPGTIDDSISECAGAGTECSCAPLFSTSSGDVVVQRET